MSDGEDGRIAVLAALDRLTAWPEMARSPQLTRFLDYIVRRRVDGDTQSIKAYSIAVDVFGRPADFDPQSDPIVRVQARRLRALLDQYYRGPGADEQVQIHLPIGRYVPDFVEVAAQHDAKVRVSGRAAAYDSEAMALDELEASPRPRGYVTVSWLVLLVIALGAMALAYSLSTWGPRRDLLDSEAGGLQPPSLRIMDFQNLTGDPAISAAISGLAIELVTDFATFIVVDVAYGGRGDVAIPPDKFDGYVLTGIVRLDADNADDFQLSVILTDLQTNSVTWNWSLTFPKEELLRSGGVSDISEQLLSVLGGQKGPLHARARDLLARSNVEGPVNFYTCSVLFNMYRTSPTAGSSARIKSCLSSLPEKTQQDPNVMAAMASVEAETIDTGSTTTALQLERFGKANALISKALELAPTSSFVWEQRAFIHDAMGAHDLAEAAYVTALQLNPANLDAAAAHARHLALIGRLDEAIPMAEHAIRSASVSTVPVWYYCVPALAELRDHGYKRALFYAESCALGDRELGPVLAILAAQGLGDAEAVMQQLPRVLEVPTFRNVGIMSQLRRRITDTALLNQIRDGLTQAGVPSMSLVAPF